ncbi:RHE_PE00001 family protein [Rhizobium giardinii]|uniref:RHE_PE00001 family protein n=1 Tax=Rhizobium giardinii TaxID=56731 RepID=UPI000DDBA032
MPYDLSKLLIQTLLRPVSDATAALARLDERVARSPVGAGWIERSHFADACASLWIDGELVHLEDLVLHDAGADIRAPTHELTIARDVLRTRRRIAAQPPGWALSADGLRSLRGQLAEDAADISADDNEPTGAPEPSVALAPVGGGEGDGREIGPADPLEKELAAIDAVIARSEAAIAEVRSAGRRIEREKDPLVYDLDWDEDARLGDWGAALEGTDGLPPVLRAIVALDAWNELQVLQHAPWLGRLLAGSVLHEAGLTTAEHLVAFNLGLKNIPVERRRHRDRDTRLSALTHGLIVAAQFGLKEHDRLTLARQLMERRLTDKRTSSKLPELIELVMTRPLVSAGMVAEALKITPRAALRIVEELGLREMTGRGRFRAWGVM